MLVFSVMTEIEIRAFEEDEVNKAEKEEIVNNFFVFFTFGYNMWQVKLMFEVSGLMCLNILLEKTQTDLYPPGFWQLI